MPDEYLAFNGTTVGGQIENLSKREEGEKVRVRERGMERDKALERPALKKQQSNMKQYRMVPNHHHHTPSAWNGTSQSVPVSRAVSPPVLPSLPGRWAEKKKGVGRVGGERGVGKRKSFFNIFGSARREGGGG